MNVWGYILIFVVVITALVLVLAILLNLITFWFAHRYSRKTIEKNLNAIKRLLPGKNCGACGCETCEEYAHAVFTCHMDTGRCAVGGEELQKQLDARMAHFQKVLESGEEKIEYR